jgi:hypothetical protein
VKFKSAMVGLVVLGGAALFGGAASAMPIAPMTSTNTASNIEQVRWVCGPYRCWWRPNYYGAYGFYGGPRYYGYGPRWGYHRGWHRGWHRW